MTGYLSVKGRFFCFLLLSIFLIQKPSYAERDLKTSSSEPSGNEFARAGKAASLLDPKESLGLASSTKSLTREEKKALKEKIKRLQQEKKEKFEELTDGFIRKIVTAKAVISKEAFLQPGARGLEDCIERAIQEHVPARAAEERVKLAQQRIIKALRDLFAEAAVEFEQRNGALNGQGFVGGSYHFRFKQPVFTGGNLWNSFLREKATLKAAEAEKGQIVNDLVQSVADIYFESIRAHNVLKDRQELLDRGQGILKKSKKMWEQGLISEIEYLNVEALQSQLGNDLQQAQEDYELAYLELQRLLNLDIEDKIELVPFYSYQKVMSKASKKANAGTAGMTVALDKGEPLKPLDEYIKIAYKERPDLNMEANRLRSSIMAKRAAFGKLLPQVSMVIEFGELGESFIDVPGTDYGAKVLPNNRPEFQSFVEATWNLGGSTFKYSHDHDQNAASVSQFQGGNGTTTNKDTFSLALLDNIEDVYKLREAQIEIMDEFVKLEEKEREVIKEVKEAYFSYKKAKIQFQAQLKQLLYRQRNVQLQKHKLEQNEIQVSEYIGAENELADEKAQLHRVMAEYYSARAGLNRAVGKRDMLPIEEWQ